MKLTRNLIQNRNITQADICEIKKEITFERIEKVVMQITGIRTEAMHMKTRVREIVESRQLVISFARKHTSFTLKEIGNHFGKCHATVINSCKNIDNLRQTDKQIKTMYTEISELL